METIKLKPLFVLGQEVMGIILANNELEQIVRRINNIKWSTSNKCWYLLLSEAHYNLLMEAVKDIATVDNSLLKAYLNQRKRLTVETGKPVIVKKIRAQKLLENHLNPANLEALRLFMDQLKLKGYSSSTIKTYRSEFMALLEILKKKDVRELTTENLRRYIIYCIENKKLSEATIHSRINALKFYFEQVLGNDKIFFEIPRPKKHWQLPHFFNQDEVAAIINSVDNIKHKVMLMLAYGAGLRVSEVVSLRTANVDSKRMSIFIARAKGKKDRMVTLSPVLLVMMREYWKRYKPQGKGYLFPGQNTGEPYTTRSLQLILDRAKAKAGIIKPGSVHALRHSFATHLLDKGTDVTMIMKLLGHNNIRTTLRYLHVTNRDMLQIISPLDDLKLK